MRPVFSNARVRGSGAAETHVLRSNRGVAVVVDRITSQWSLSCGLCGVP